MVTFYVGISERAVGDGAPHERVPFAVDGLDCEVCVPAGYTLTDADWECVLREADDYAERRAIRMAERSLMDAGHSYSWVWEGYDPQDFPTRADVVAHVEDAVRVTYRHHFNADAWTTLLTWAQYRDLVQHDVDAMVEQMCAWADVVE